MSKKDLDKYHVIFEFPLLWSNWECDEKGYILENEKGKRVFSYDQWGHETMKVQFLKEKLGEYRKVSKATREAIELLEPNTNKEDKK